MTQVRALAFISLCCSEQRQAWLLWQGCIVDLLPAEAL
jgi:hypothetical protein